MPIIFQGVLRGRKNPGRWMTHSAVGPNSATCPLSITAPFTPGSSGPCYWDGDGGIGRHHSGRSLGHAPITRSESSMVLIRWAMVNIVVPAGAVFGSCSLTVVHGVVGTWAPHAFASCRVLLKFNEPFADPPQYSPSTTTVGSPSRVKLSTAIQSRSEHNGSAVSAHCPTRMAAESLPMEWQRSHRLSMAPLFWTAALRVSCIRLSVS